MRKIINFLLSSLLLVSCEIKVNTHGDDKSGGKIRNGIQVKENGLKVEQAFLLFEDGKLVPSNNKVDLGQWVGLRLIMAGWQKKEENYRIVQKIKRAPLLLLMQLFQGLKRNM